MGDLTEAARSFLETFSPRLGTYLIWDAKAKPDRYGRLWRWRRSLTDELVEEAQQGRVILSFMCLPEVEYFGLDIDDHDTGGWVGGSPTKELQDKATETIHCVGKPPSVMFRSPHGIHAFWFFDKRLPVVAVEAIIKERIGETAEFLPRYRSGIRMPTLAGCVDEELEKKEMTSFCQIGRYPYKELFGEEAEPESIKERLTMSPQGLPLKKAKDPKKRIEAEEMNCPPFRNHGSNQSYCRLVGVYFAERLLEEEVIERIMAFADRSPGYAGDLKGRAAVETRVKESFANLHRPEDLELRAMALLRDPGVHGYIGKLATRLGIASEVRARRRLENFIVRMKAWVDFIDKIADDYASRSYWTYLYPGFAKFHKQGYVPIPSKQLKDWNSHYDLFIGDLIREKVMEESPYNYSTHGRCRYYRIDPALRSIKVLTGVS